MSLEDGLQPKSLAQDLDASSTFLQAPTLKANPSRHRRVSQFKELGIDTTLKSPSSSEKPRRRVRFGSMADVFEAHAFDRPKSPDDDWPLSGRATPDYSVLLKSSVEPSPKLPYITLGRLLSLTFIIAVILAIVHNSPLIGSAGDTILGVKGGVIRFRAADQMAQGKTLGARQQDSGPTDYCTKWSHQSALVNGTIYIYGGNTKRDQDQTQDTWTNDFLTIDVTKTWKITSPTLKGLDQPSGPPAVANAYLWHSFTQLFLYGGAYSDSPITSPSAFAMWQYDIPSSKWIEHSSPSTSSGNYSDGGNVPVQDSAEGAGISIPELGRGYFFGGHQDFLTTQGWSNQVARIYLNSMIEFTFPGFSNDGIEDLRNGKTAGDDGAWRNITKGGIQASDGFPERADGVLVHVPGFGQQGLILGLAGGSNQSLTEMNIIDVYDIATSTWYKQATTGNSPTIRVNPCAVALSAEDGSSTNVYMYGGQNLLPTGKQVQYEDIWILSVPSFTWVKVSTDNLSNPPPRAGHSCEVWDGQMVVVGGYVGANVSCDYPGTYVFDASELKWQNQFTALPGSDDQSQQNSQSGNDTGLSGSYGYQVPAAVQSVIGGNGRGGATITTPAAGATEGPLATGRPIVYTITASGSVVTETAGASGGGGGFSNQNQSSGPNVAAIAAGTVAGVLFIVACYLGFCAWVYRRQLQLYKNHVAAAQRAAAAPTNEKYTFLGHRSSEEPSSSNRRSTEANSSHPSGNSSRYPRSTNEVPPPLPGQLPGTNSPAASSNEDLLLNHEPSFMGVLLNPRRSLRVVNRD